MTGGREVALSALLIFRKTGVWSDTRLRELCKGLADPRDRALAERIAFGVLQNTALLDYAIASVSSVKPRRMEAAVLEILRLSVYQLLFMDRIPVSAVVAEGVEMVKRRSPRAAGLANAVLRRLGQAPGTLPQIPREEETAYLSTRYSVPPAMTELLLAELGEECEPFLAASNAPAPVELQVNPLKTTAAALLEALGKSGVQAEAHPWLPNCLRVTGDFTRALGAISRGEAWVQDAAARLAVTAAGARPGMRVLDLCAAPGGKSFAAAADMENRGSILARDISEKKLALVAEGAKRLGVTILTAQPGDAASPWSGEKELFDLVLADVPCSGLGVLRRKPDIRCKDPDALSRLPALQLAILRAAASRVRRGGALLYSTCTVLRRENAGVVEEFLSAAPEFSREAFVLPQPLGECGAGELTLYPQTRGTDGFYLCKLRRSGGSHGV